MGTRDKFMDLVLQALDAPEGTEPPLSEEEKERRYQIGRNHVIGRFKRHNEHNHDITCKLHIKQHALQMLPRHSYIKDDAMKQYERDEKEPDYMLPPGPRIMPGLWELVFPPKEEEKDDD